MNTKCAVLMAETANMLMENATPSHLRPRDPNTATFSELFAHCTKTTSEVKYWLMVFMDFLQLKDKTKPFWKRVDSEPTRHPMKANIEIIWNT